MSQKNKRTDAAPAPSQGKSALALLARLLAGGLLIYSGALKASAPAEEFSVVIEMYNILPMGASITAATFLPWVELLLGWALLMGWMTRAAAAAALGLFATFTLAILSTKLRGIELANCGCFGGAIHPTPGAMLMIDLVLASLCWLLYKLGPGGPSLDNWAGRSHT